ncbi:hypothetical protein AAKU52_000976 [Pedobacter sp. CG_S7]
MRNSNQFVADLKRLAEMPRRMKEFEELGKLINKRFSADFCTINH